MDNNDLNNNLTAGGPTSETIIKADEFSNNDLATLMSKYSEKKLFERVFKDDTNYFLVVDELRSRQHQIITNFWPGDKRLEVNPSQRRQIINVLTRTEPTADINQLIANLQQISPDLAVTNAINLGDLIERSKPVKRAFDNLETLILNHFCYDYLQDTMLFYKTDDATLANFETQIKVISDKMADQLDQFTKNKFDKNETLVKDALSLLGQLGRTKLFIREEKEDKDLGQLIDIYSRLELALNAAKALKEKQIGPADDLNTMALEEIKLLLKNDIVI